MIAGIDLLVRPYEPVSILLSSSVERLRFLSVLTTSTFPYDSNRLSRHHSHFQPVCFIMIMKLCVPLLLVLSSAVIPAFSLPVPFSSSHALRRDDQGDDNSTQSNGDNSTQSNGDNSTQSNGVNSNVQNVVYLNDTATRFPGLAYLAQGNQDFISAVAASPDPNLLQNLTTNGEHPEYLFLGCRFVVTQCLLSDPIFCS